MTTPTVTETAITKEGCHAAPTSYVLWGFSDRQRVPIKLTGGTLRECHSAQRRRDGWTCAIYLRGTEPLGLRAMADVDR